MNDQQLYALSKKIGKKLLQRKVTVTCAESCTGGWIAKVFTDISGSSAWFERGFVTYSNAAKHELLSVCNSTLKHHGAVSEAVIREMAVGAQRAARANYAIAVSGIAGPSGGSREQPIGTVWFGFTAPSGVVIADLQKFWGDREAVRRQSVAWALQVLFSQFLTN